MLAIYTRLSKEDVKGKKIDENNSILNQKREGKIFAGDKSYEIYDEGKGFSGTLRIKERPRLNQLLQDIEAGKITSVWMRKQDRLARSGITVLMFCDVIKNNDVKLYFGDKGLIDLNDPTEFLHLTIMAGFDEFKPSTQSKVTKQNLRLNAEEGKVCGIIPYGYYTENSFPFVDKKQEKVINQIYDSYLEGKGTQLIANVLNDAKEPTKYHLLEATIRENLHTVIWQSSTIRKILQCTWYNGTREYQGTTYQVPRIVDEVKFSKIQKALESRKYKRYSSRPSYNYLMKGLLKCEKCGRNFMGRTREKTYENMYLCSSKRSGQTNCGTPNLNLKRFDSFIIKHLFKTRNLLDKLKEIQNSNSVVVSLKEEIETITSKLKKAKVKEDNFATLLGGALKDNAVILKKFNNAQAEISKLKDALINVKTKLEDATNSEALEKYENVFNALDINSDFETIKSAVDSIIETVTIYSSVDSGGQMYFIIKIDYIGFNEYSMFSTIRPYKVWLHLGNTRAEPTPEEIQDDIDALEFILGDKKPVGKVITAEDVKQDFYTDKEYFKMTIEKSDIIDFNPKSVTKN